MKELRDRIADISAYLSCLTKPEVCHDVQNAIDRKDRNKLIEICRKIAIPDIYIASIVSILLTIGPTQKWPGYF